MKTHENIENLLNATEGEYYQFKEWKTKGDLKEAVRISCALANCGGGKLVIGVSDERPRKIVGSTAFPQPERTRVDIMNKLHVRITFEIHEHEKRRVLVFDVASRPIGLPVQADGGAWWYHGDSLILIPEEIRRSIYMESGHDFSGDICLDATINDLDNNAIEIFRTAWVENSGNKRIAKLTDEQLLRDCDALTNEGVTYAALILFGKRAALLKHLPQAEIIFEYRSSEASGPAAQREEFLESFFNSYDRIWELVNLRNDNHHYQKGFAVLPVPSFNERVVREALLNAVSHRDYQLAGSIFVRQYRCDRLVIESPGGFPAGITVENILDRQSPRNNRIAKIFQLCGFVERSGQGMNLIYETAVKEAKPLPTFEGSDEYFVKLTISGKVLDDKMLAWVKKVGEDRLEAMTTDDYILVSALFHREELEKIKPSHFGHLIELGLVKHTEHGFYLVDVGITFTGQNLSDCQAIASDCQAIETNDRKKQIIAFIAENKKATSGQVASHIGLSQARARVILQELVAEGVIVKVGDNRYTEYVLKDSKD